MRVLVLPKRGCADDTPEVVVCEADSLRLLVLNSFDVHAMLAGMS